MEQKMFCYQCQETAGCKGCTMSGVCGKKPDVAAMQDLRVYDTKGISAVTTSLRQAWKQVSAENNHLITLNLFTTITNANFDKESFEARIRASLSEKDVLVAQMADPSGLPEAAKWIGSGNWEDTAATVGVLSSENEDIRSLRELANFDKENIEAINRATLIEKDVLLAQIADPSGLPKAAKWNGSGNWEEKAATVGVLSTENEYIRSLRELITYGLKGLSAYSKHETVLLKDDDDVDAFLQRSMAATLDDNLSVSHTPNTQTFY